MKRLVVIDGMSVFYRGYYAMSGLSTRDGTPTGGVYGFAVLALELIRKLKPDYVAVAWDKKDTSIRRRLELMPGYKAGRKAPPEDFYAQIPLLHELLAAFSWPLYECDDYEADDIMGALAGKAEALDIETCLVTGDLDMLQLVNDHTHVYALKNGLANIQLYNPATFEDTYGIHVHQFLDLKALKGDSSDKIPGVPGIGEKTALQLLQDYKTLDGIYDHLDDIRPPVAAKLIAGKESAYLSREVAEIWLDAPVEFDPVTLDAHRVDTAKLAELLKRFEFHSLLNRLPDHMQAGTQGELFAQTLSNNTQPLEEKPWPSELTIDAAQPVQLYVAGDRLWISTDRTSVYSRDFADIDTSIRAVLGMAYMVAYDIKAQYHAAHAAGVELRFERVYDLRQGAFLLDPLSRGRSIAGLVGEGIDTANASLTMAALWVEYDRQAELMASNERIRTVAETMDFPLTYTLYRMESRGIKINPNALSEMSGALGDEHAALEKKMHDMAGGEFNIASPAQLSDVLFEKLGLPTSGIKKGKTGYSTGQKELDKLRGQHPIIELIERTRELAKLKNTYVDTLPLLADGQGRIHTTFNQDVAATGRLSSTDPNLQNIPVRTELGRHIRSAFVPEKGNVFVSADYSQFELRLAAVLAGDTHMIEDFNNDVDIHVKTASEVLGIPMEEVTKDLRRSAKAINFGILYGMSPHGLAAAANMSFADAKHFIDRYFEVRQPIRAYMDKTLQQAMELGYVETYYGRRRPTPDVKSSNFMVREGARRAAINMPIQGTEADLMKLAMLRVDERLGGLGEQLLQIHDSILVECPRENADKVAEILKTTMESIAPELAVKLKVDVAMGDDWGKL